MDNSASTSKGDNAYDEASHVAKVFFNWIRKPFWKSFKGLGISNEDLGCAPLILEASRLGPQIKAKWATGEKDNANRRLLVTFCRLFWRKCVCLSAFGFLKTIFLLLQVATLGILIDLYTTDDENLRYQRYIAGIVLIILVLLGSFIAPHMYFNAELMGARLRISSSVLVYEKLISILTAEIKRVDVGHMINLFASDVAKFDQSGKYICGKLFDPIAMVVNMVFLQLTVGLPGLIGFVAMILLGSSTFWFKIAFKKIGTVRAKLIDQRLNLTTEMISEVRTIKMLCWEDVYCETIKNIRKKELRLAFLNYCCKSLHFIVTTSSGQIGILFYFIASFLLGEPFNAKSVYMCFAILNMTRLTLILGMARIFEHMAYSLVSFKRLQQILLINTSKVTNEPDATVGSPLLISVTSSWYPQLQSQQFCLKDLNIVFPQHNVTMITGPVGSGKSALLLTLAGEMYIHSGHVRSGGNVTYMPQETWLFPSTIKQNILFGLPFDQQRYYEVVSSCALDMDLTMFENGDQTIVDDKGLTLSGGQRARIALARSLYRNCDIYLLDDPLSAVDTRVAQHIWKRCFQEATTTIVMVSHCLHLLGDNHYIVQLDKNEVVVGPFGDVKNRLKLEDPLNTVNEDSPPTSNDVTTISNDTESKASTVELQKSNKTASGESFKDALLYYAKTAWSFLNGFGILILIASLIVISQSFRTAFDITVSRWVQAQNQISIAVINGSNTTKFTADDLQTNLSYTGFFLGMKILTDSILLLTFFSFTIRASKKLHEKMLNALSRTGMAFYDSHNTGQIMNRFAKDVEVTDDHIPIAFWEIILITFTIIGVLTNASYGNPAACAPMILGIIAIILIVRMYLIAVDPLKRMEASARSPIYSYMSCSLNGSSVIRSHGNQAKVTKEFNNRQDYHSSIWFLMTGMNFWLALVCDITGSFLSISVIILTLVFPNLTNSSKLGIGISSTITLGHMLQAFVRVISDINHKTVAVDRIKKYISIPADEGYSSELQSPPPQWPQAGGIAVSNLRLFYSTRNQCALNNISFEIKPSEKIGIVGRTGAGKSSIVAALFRLAHTDGTISIDGIDIKTLKVVEYRKSLTIIPQNPVALSGSIRQNLDPSNEYNDEDVWNALDNVNLKDVVANLEHKLDSGMQHFSVGQKQLVCLARALLQNKKIIIFDEATSNIDNKTDSMIQKLIRTEFSKSTLLVIAHRLQTVIDLDRIMVLQSGHIAEFDSPVALLNNPSSIFRKMVLYTNKNI